MSFLRLGETIRSIFWYAMPMETRGASSFRHTGAQHVPAAADEKPPAAAGTCRAPRTEQPQPPPEQPQPPPEQPPVLGTKSKWSASSETNRFLHRKVSDSVHDVVDKRVPFASQRELYLSPMKIIQRHLPRSQHKLQKITSNVRISGSVQECFQDQNC